MQKLLGVGSRDRRMALVTTCMHVVHRRSWSGHEGAQPLSHLDTRARIQMACGRGMKTGREGACLRGVIAGTERLHAHLARMSVIERASQLALTSGKY